MVKTLIKNGDHCFVCDDCSSIRKIDTPETKCKKCGAWYRVEITKTVGGDA